MKPGYDGDAVDVVGLEAGVRDRARAPPRTVRSMSVRKSRRPIADCPTPERMARRSSRSSGATRRGGRASTSAVSVRFGGRLGRGAQRGQRGPRRLVGLEDGQRDLVRQPCGSVTRTGMPMRTASGGQPTMLVVSRRLRCSTSSTMAMTYGTSSPGIQRWWLTV